MNSTTKRPTMHTWILNRRVRMGYLFLKNPNKHTVRLVSLLLLVTIGLHASETIPYPDAIKSAAVSVNSISHISRNGLVVGNGELNAIIYSVGNDLRLRIGKNDCWDLRVNTKNDPPMPVIDPATGTVTGFHGPAGSWESPYPIALPCAELILGGSGQAPVSNATLDIGKAVATIKSGGNSEDVRVLAQNNVILIRSNRPASFAGILDFLKSGSISKAEEGTKDAYHYIRQSIPGDEDMSGMDIYVVHGRKEDLQAIAVVTSRDSQHPLDDAIALVASTLGDPKAITKHETIWEEYWSKSGIQLGDRELQNWWYRMLYFNRVFARSNGNVIGLAACFDHLAGWHNSLKFNYNIQQTYLAAAAVNHPELLEPLIDMLNRNLPRGKWFAATSFKGAEGAFFHSDSYPFEPDPAKCVSNYKHQQTYMPWGYTLGMAGHTTVVIWDYYKFAPTKAHLDRIYPLIKEFGTFYWSILKQCPLVDGKRKIGPSFFPELGEFNQYNVCYDISFITASLRIAREAPLLKKDTAFVARIDEVINQLPTYGTEPDPEQGGQTVIQKWSEGTLKEKGGVDRHGTLLQGIFPAGLINWFSLHDEKELAKRTIHLVERTTSHANSNVTINIARARLGLGDEAIANAKLCFSGTTGKYSKEQPNGLFYWNAHGYYMTEQVAIARLVTELLLQSVGDVIRIFPAWPTSTDAQFTNLPAQGGFEVSASLVGGKITEVRIHSAVGGSVKLESPWKQEFTVVEVGSKVKVPVTTEANGTVFATSAGKSYLLLPASDQ